MKNKSLLLFIFILFIIVSCKAKVVNLTAVENLEIMLLGSDLSIFPVDLEFRHKNITGIDHNSSWIGYTAEGLISHTLLSDGIAIKKHFFNGDVITIGIINEKSRIWLKVKEDLLYIHKKNYLGVYKIHNNSLTLIDELHLCGYISDALYVDKTMTLIITGLTYFEKRNLIACRITGEDIIISSDVNGFIFESGYLFYVEENHIYKEAKIRLCNPFSVNFG